MDVFRSDDPPTIVVVVELAGLEPKDVELSVADGVLFVRGKRTRPHAGGRQYHQMEINWGAFERRITLPEVVDSEQGKATYDRGLLTIVLPMRPAPSSSVSVRIIAQSASVTEDEPPQADADAEVTEEARRPSCRGCCRSCRFTSVVFP